MPFQPVDSQRLYQQVADQIGELIRRNEFPAGHRLPPERDLAKALGVSRPVVREAMIALELAGLVEVRTGSGTYVTPQGKPSSRLVAVGDAGPSPFDVLSARIMIEGEIAFLAATMANATDLADIEGICEAMAQDVERGHLPPDSDRQFHKRIAEATHNTVLPPLVEDLWEKQFAPVFSALSERTRLPENYAATIAAHRAIAGALQRRDPEGARKAMHDHLEQVMSVLLSEAGES
jgi:DNA-binding FadR family transcriptional regulator